MINSTIYSIFPTPIYFTKLNRKFKKQEIKIFELYRKKFIPNIGNKTSINNYILELKEFKELKKDINLIIQDYFNKVIDTSNKIIPYITQSWLNYTEEKDFHHEHEHPNSLISGVFYIDADINNDKIIFNSKKYNIIELNPKEYNLYNSKTWFFPVESNQLVLFPSSLNHYVEQKKGINTRLSLAFNVFIKGEIGDESSLTKLII
jgi:uncharacterized protein (TIGR02466 family)